MGKYISSADILRKGWKELYAQLQGASCCVPSYFEEDLGPAGWLVGNFKPSDRTREVQEGILGEITYG